MSQNEAKIMRTKINNYEDTLFDESWETLLKAHDKLLWLSATLQRFNDRGVFLFSLHTMLCCPSVICSLSCSSTRSCLSNVRWYHPLRQNVPKAFTIKFTCHNCCTALLTSCFTSWETSYSKLIMSSSR